MTANPAAMGAPPASFGQVKASGATGSVALAPARFSMLLEGIGWRMPVRRDAPRLAEAANGDPGLLFCGQAAFFNFLSSRAGPSV